ncbi:D-beta-hydroxybutyrate dehydrogenase, mitochondrial-like [Haliotis rufescens]|uniref:D-beta-hydroxybutyrate dehydrogenase, mitochondrial-like n=1 Tax=Haliotis rufescens TaxID=6454 RepID=UPI001EAF9380|nr:D-beta-hydroxybutyrate dehydrogenase, mitochondrial-like [Haliotis rufescens]XP_046351860.1 D-beta-hydroxybutyrate dehydrogenase, mitochondrial-like [Haliotis rufescens]
MFRLHQLEIHRPFRHLVSTKAKCQVSDQPPPRFATFIRGGMKLKQFVHLQVFELFYLLVLAFLPFIVAQKVVGLTILTVIGVFGFCYIFKKLLTKTIEITGQAVLITGCDSGFGNAIARRLDSMGFLVLAGCLSEKSDGAERLKASGSGRIHVFELDVTNDYSVESCLERVNQLTSERGLWALVNNAGINFEGDFEFCTLDMFRQVMEVNLYGAIRMTKAFLPLIRRAKGRVINVSSAKGQLAAPNNSVYGVTKFGLESLSDVLRLEMSQFGVKVVVVEPGNFGGATGMLSKPTLTRMRDEYDEMWEKASSDVKETYGKAYLDAKYDAFAQSASTTCSTLAPVIDALEDSVCNVKPLARYLVSGSNKWFDYFVILIYLKTILPVSWIDSLIIKQFIKPYPRAAQAVR